jgi:hypothetical protein
MKLIFLTFIILLLGIKGPAVASHDYYSSVPQGVRQQILAHVCENDDLQKGMSELLKCRIVSRGWRTDVSHPSLWIRFLPVLRYSPCLKSGSVVFSKKVQDTDYHAELLGELQTVLESTLSVQGTDESYMLQQWACERVCFFFENMGSKTYDPKVLIKTLMGAWSSVNNQLIRVSCDQMSFWSDLKVRLSHHSVQDWFHLRDKGGVTIPIELNPLRRHSIASAISHQRRILQEIILRMKNAYKLTLGDNPTHEEQAKAGQWRQSITTNIRLLSPLLDKVEDILKETESPLLILDAQSNLNVFSTLLNQVSSRVAVVEEKLNEN